MSTRISLTVNGVKHVLDVADDALLLDVLREQVGTTSVREGCGVGACGACTVLADGKGISSCLALAVRYDGADLTTAEGLDDNDEVVSSFVECGAAQCGYCIPGMVVMTKELLAQNPRPSAEQITEHLAGNLCRCGTYPEILQAATTAASRRAAQ
ncbi:(2Fe-2S)-binding protein [Thermocrispum municipale]|jgi:aerobic-type carbon monoxide dehydrogenase small subunit (CoxS/CutS family)|uniref:(2Fe-2S)-binding protein n=1 Tax=Thermocrispum municipale TaxID=37926 RepID=UPI0003F79A3E|nr:(2Fe-2S)-binding protein [Thermocrispum municipale]